MATKIKTYRQPDRSTEWLHYHPEETWRCDISPDDGSDHHGIGSTEASAILNAAMAYLAWTKGQRP